MAVDLVIDIENTPGALARVAAAISDAGVNIAAATCVGPGERAELALSGAQVSERYLPAKLLPAWRSYFHELSASYGTQPGLAPRTT